MEWTSDTTERRSHSRSLIGTTGISINTDAFVDITAAHVETFVVSLDDGDDTLSGAGNATTGAAFPTAHAARPEAVPSPGWA